MRPNYPYMAVFVSITWRFFSGLGNTPKKKVDILLDIIKYYLIKIILVLLNFLVVMIM